MLGEVEISLATVVTLTSGTVKYITDFFSFKVLSTHVPGSPYHKSELENLLEYYKKKKAFFVSQ